MQLFGSTYRLQFCPEFTFDMARNALPYLRDLGVTDLYASPIFKPVDGSSHGYDIVDTNCVNPELGGHEKFLSLVSYAKELRLEWLQDIVPNHMAFDYNNSWLSDVLEKGQKSQYASYFDIDWDHAYENIKGRVLAPFLGEFYGTCLEKGELRLNFSSDGFVLNYFDLKFPIAIESYRVILSYRLKRLKEALGEDHPDFIKFLGLLYVARSLATGEESGEIYDQARFVKRMLWEMYTSNGVFKLLLDENIKIFNGDPGIPESFNTLDELLSQQVFRLSYWKIATKEINYRRFFNINALISLRVENSEVFDRSHAMILDLVRNGNITGLRIDHLDGLYDPKAYLERLNELIPTCDFIVEKILARNEELPQDLKTKGSTGYDFARFLNGIFVARQNEKSINRIYHGFIGTRIGFQTLLEERKRLIIFEHMAGDVNNLVQELKSISSRDRHGSDITHYGLRRALMEVMVSFPVYRTYISEQTYSEADRKTVEFALDRAIKNNPALFPELEFIKNFLLLDYPNYSDEIQKTDWLRFVMRFQQFTGPLMAKSMEDTCFYIHNRLISLNEVGGDPGCFGEHVDDFHKFIKRRAAVWKYSLNATSTHDTKRGEDTRARINVLSEIPDEWENCLKTWNRLNRPKKMKIDGLMVPDRNDEYFLYQTLLGVWPFSENQHDTVVQRIKEYVVKAVREAKIHTAWIRPDLEYEKAYLSFVESILVNSESNSFLKDFKKFSNKISYLGIFNSLAQTLIKITAPGIPDFYQGSELWDLSLVDPDNRRLVNFHDRSKLLKEIRHGFKQDLPKLISRLLSTPSTGAVKMFVIWRGLQLRSLNMELFGSGSYLPLEVRGSKAKNVISFARQDGKKTSITIVPRLCSQLVEPESLKFIDNIWGSTEVIVPKSCRNMMLSNAFTGETLVCQKSFPVSESLSSFPIGLFIND